MPFPDRLAGTGLRTPATELAAAVEPALGLSTETGEGGADLALGLAVGAGVGVGVGVEIEVEAGVGVGVEVGVGVGADAEGRLPFECVGFAPGFGASSFGSIAGRSALARSTRDFGGCLCRM